MAHIINNKEGICAGHAAGKRFFSTTRLALLAAALLFVPAMHAAVADADSAAMARSLDKARMFYDNGEWLNASAAYLLLADRNPGDAGICAHLVVSNCCAGDTVQAIDNIGHALQANVDFDKLLDDIRTLSFAQGNATLYERLLLLCKGHFKWMSRNLDRQLLYYYDFRDNGQMMVHYALAMLAPSPAHTPFALILARGYMLEGGVEQAADVYKGILHREPENLDALLALGNLYAVQGHKAEARPLLERAYKLRPTPYLQKLLYGKCKNR